MEPEGKHRNSIMKQRILAVFGLVEIVLRCTLTMNDFQDLMMQLEASSFEAQPAEGEEKLNHLSELFEELRLAPRVILVCSARKRDSPSVGLKKRKCSISSAASGLPLAAF
ncbi:hypothetical protein EVAR_44047_1 [Eumeta japonica]|uniref:Uncharacterized protein n=1 Tax=Eumeta variegata TaxID=151549 RepID=A0A4C1XKF2_EUMVA|nr:hypothetical protein EVAR_44047_1 [Eumeta japonica]